MLPHLQSLVPGGDIEYINGTVEDITEHKQDLSELQALRQELDEIIEFLPDPACIIDQDRTVIAWNSAMEHITGISKNEIIGALRKCLCIQYTGCSTTNAFRSS